MPKNKITLCLLVLTLLLGALPYVPYGWARIFGSLPSEAVWAMRGGNHGPWWCHEPHQTLMVLPMLLLAALSFPTFLISIVHGLVIRHATVTLQGFGLCLLQWGLAFLHLITVFWTID